MPRESPLGRIKTLLEYRLTDRGKSAAVKREWTQIVEGRHRLWRASVCTPILRGVVVALRGGLTECGWWLGPQGIPNDSKVSPAEGGGDRFECV